MSMTVTVLDTAGIQPFIFGSNVLRENIGASELVHRATRLWAFEALQDLGENHNIDLVAAKKDDVAAMYRPGGFQADGSDIPGAEVLYAGGGNTVVLFQGSNHDGRARDFVYHLSRRLLADAPGLNLYAAHQTYTWGQTPSLPDVVDNAMKELGRHKGSDPGSRPALGFPVTAACTSTGLPANATHVDPEYSGKTGGANRVNRQVNIKWETARQEARSRLQNLFQAVGRDLEFDWCDEFDKLARLPERDDSYIAVVHADGNGMGQRIKILTDFWRAKPDHPRGYIDAMRGLSNSVQITAQDALKATLSALYNHLNNPNGPGPDQHPTIKEKRKQGGKETEYDQKYFPVRPVVFGGDDVTLVCAGPWGLAIANRYLRELENLSLGNPGKEKEPPYACAGVAIVKTHYPFSQAYALSEELIKQAKNRSKELAGKKASAIDWHFTTTGLHGDLETIRAREYFLDVPGGGCLPMRPLMLKPDYGWRNWDNLTGLLTVFGEHGDWQDRRNKIMRLREALRGGPDRVAEFFTIYEENENTILRRTQFDNTNKPVNGWVPADSDCKDKKSKKPAIKTEPDSKEKESEEQEKLSRCAYFDAIEIGEQFFSLPDPKQEGA
jgi:hypothetical protein